MRLFRRKTTMEVDGPHCPRCIERVPKGATECGMCGLDLRPLRSTAANPRTDEAGEGELILPPVSTASRPDIP